MGSIWNETRYIPDIKSSHVLDGCINVCNGCEKWGEACETCGISVPIVSDFHEKKVTMTQMTICGVPVGSPYEILLEDEVYD